MKGVGYRNMSEVKSSPEGRGKHIVCIYAHRAAAADIQTVSGRTPNPQTNEREVNYQRQQKQTCSIKISRE